MNIHEIVEKLKEKFSLEELNVNNNSCSITIDTLPVEIEEIENSIIILVGLIGDPPIEKKEDFANLLLESNLALVYSKNHIIARNAESGSYVLLERISIEQSSFPEFLEHLEKFSDTLENYHKILENFSPAAQQAATLSKEQQEDMMSALRNGFLRA